MGISKKHQELILKGCGSAEAIKDIDIVGYQTINDLLQKPFDTYIGSFEVPQGIKDLMDIDQINSVIEWYLHWKLTSPIAQQNTCTIKDIFGDVESIKVIVAINLYKYLRNKGYEPQIMEIFLKNNK